MEEEFTALASEFQVAVRQVQHLCEVEGADQNTAAYGQRQGRLRGELGRRFEPLRAVIRQVIDHPPRASSLVENLNSALRNYFFLRRQLGDGFLELLRFFLNHRPFLRSDCPRRVGKTPAELLTGRPTPTGWNCWALSRSPEIEAPPSLTSRLPHSGGHPRCRNCYQK